jgi:Tfp pilus assembly PilM family ATPase
MAKMLVLEWDSREARVIAISQKGRKWTLEDAFAVALPARDASAGDKVVGPMLKDALAKRGYAGAKCKLVVGRSSIELRYLMVPQAPPEEMPDLVRFQALRQFSQLGEEWPLDFIPVSDNGETQLVLAASIIPSALNGLTDVCEAAGLVPEQVYLRPFAAAANIADEAVAEGQERRLIVDVLCDEADLVVVDRGRPIFCRTVKLPVGPDAAEARSVSLAGEIRRTVAAALNQIPGQEITHISLFGVGAESAAILERLKQANFTTESIDPFAEIDPVRIAELKPAQRGSFAPLLGVMHILSGASTPMIDFLHPRQRPLPPDNRWRNMVAVAAGVMLLLAGLTGYYFWSGSVNAELTRLNDELKTTQAKIKDYEHMRIAALAVENFEKTNISAAEKLAQVSDLMPPGDRVMLKTFNLVNPQITIGRMNKLTENPGTLTLVGGAKELADRHEIEKKLKELGTVKSDHKREGSLITNYDLSIDEQVQFEIPKIKPQSQPTAKTAVASSPTKTPQAKTPAAKTAASAPEKASAAPKTATNPSLDKK